MADRINDGGPAFPHLRRHVSGSGGGFYEPIAEGGMTLRDYFAAKAMQAIVSSIHCEAEYQRLRSLAQQDGLTVSQWIARDAYKQAGAMLAARESKPAADPDLIAKAEIFNKSQESLASVKGGAS